MYIYEIIIGVSLAIVGIVTGTFIVKDWKSSVDKIKNKENNKKDKK